MPGGLVGGMNGAIVELVLSPARPFELAAFVQRLDVANGPRSYLDADALEHWVAHPPAEIAELLDWATGLGLSRITDDVPEPIRRLRLRGTLAQLRDALGLAGLRALARRSPGAPAIAGPDALPARLRGLVARVELGSESSRPWRGELALAPGQTAPPRPARCGVTPSELERALAGLPQTDGAGQRIAMMALGGLPHAEDLAGFARSFARPQPRLELVQLGPLSPATRDDALIRHETSMSIEWIAALAPAAELRVYVIDPRACADPWAAFFEAALADRATIATTAWSCPEQQYYASHGRTVAASLLDQLAAIGCTVLAASGDWGPCAGAPRFAGEPIPASARPWPGVAFPCSEPRVLGVGGTQDLADPEPLRAALSRDLAERLALREVATGGGFSEHVGIPSWQAACLERSYARDGEAPSVPPSGRGVPDIALPAWSVSGPEGFGFCGLVDGRWRDDIGGTSLSTALAAACFARVNAALEARGRPRLGCLGPRLYQLAQARTDAMRAVARGTNAIELPCLDPRGAVVWRTLPGFVASGDWSPGVGLGVPDFARLVELATMDTDADA